MRPFYGTLIYVFIHMIGPNLLLLNLTILFDMFSCMLGQSTDGRGGRGATDDDDEDERGGQRVQCGQA